MLNTKRGLLTALALGAICASGSSALATYTWDGSSSTGWTDPDNWTKTGGDTGYPNSATADVTIPNSMPRYPVMDASVTVRDLTLAPNATMAFAASSAYTITVKQDFKVQGSGLTLTNYANEVILDASVSRLLVDGSALSATITGPGRIQMAHASATIEIPDSNDVLVFDAEIYGRGVITGSGTLTNNGLVQAAGGGTLTLNTNLKLVDDDAVRWSAINNSSQLVFKKAHTVGGSNELQGTFSIGDNSTAKFTFDSCFVETAGEFYINTIPWTSGCGGSAQGINTWHFYYWDYSVPVQVTTCP